MGKSVLTFLAASSHLSYPLPRLTSSKDALQIIDVTNIYKRFYKNKILKFLTFFILLMFFLNFQRIKISQIIFLTPAILAAY